MHMDHWPCHRRKLRQIQSKCQLRGHVVVILLYYDYSISIYACIVSLYIFSLIISIMFSYIRSFLYFYIFIIHLSLIIFLYIRSFLLILLPVLFFDFCGCFKNERWTPSNFPTPKQIPWVSQLEILIHREKGGKFGMVASIINLIYTLYIVGTYWVYPLLKVPFKGFSS